MDYRQLRSVRQPEDNLIIVRPSADRLDFAAEENVSLRQFSGQLSLDRQLLTVVDCALETASSAPTTVVAGEQDADYLGWLVRLVRSLASLSR